MRVSMLGRWEPPRLWSADQSPPTCRQSARAAGPKACGPLRQGGGGRGHVAHAGEGGGDGGGGARCAGAGSAGDAAGEGVAHRLLLLPPQHLRARTGACPSEVRAVSPCMSCTWQGWAEQNASVRIARLASLPEARDCTDVKLQARSQNALGRGC